MLTVGFEITMLPLVLFNAVTGNQVYVFAPATLRVAEVPEHTVEDALAISVGKGFTVTAMVLELEHPVWVPVTV